MRIRDRFTKALAVVALCAVGLLVIAGIALIMLNSVVQKERGLLDKKRTEYVRQLEMLVEQGAEAEAVVRLLGRENKISNSQAREAILRHAPNKADASNNVLKADRWPSASFFTDGDFTFVVFFDSEGRIKEFAVGNQ